MTDGDPVGPPIVGVLVGCGARVCVAVSPDCGSTVWVGATGIGVLSNSTTISPLHVSTETRNPSESESSAMSNSSQLVPGDRPHKRNVNTLPDPLAGSVGGIWVTT